MMDKMTATTVSTQTGSVKIHTPLGFVFGMSLDVAEFLISVCELALFPVFTTAVFLEAAA
jgi:hypothetical protein